METSVKIRSMQTGTASSYKGPTPLSHPLGVCLEGPGNSRGAAEGPLARELGRPAGRAGVPGAFPPLPPAPAGLQSPHPPSGPCPLVPLPWGRVAQLPRVSLFHVLFFFFNWSAFWYHQRASVLPVPGGGDQKKQHLEKFFWSVVGCCFLCSVSFLL